MAGEEEARQERLRQLFGEDAAKIIAQQTATKKKVEPEVPEIQMLVEGMQELSWGQVRLIDVSMTDGPLEASFEPLLPGSTLLCVRLDMPIGMLLEEAEEGAAAGSAFVSELLPDSNAELGGLEVGDVVRATTAVSMQMSYPTWNLIAGGIGRPKLQKILFPTKGEPFEKLMAAIGSNSRMQQGNDQCILLVERLGSEARE